MDVRQGFGHRMNAAENAGCRPETLGRELELNQVESDSC